MVLVALVVVVSVIVVVAVVIVVAVVMRGVEGALLGVLQGAGAAVIVAAAAAEVLVRGEAPRS